MVRSRAVVSSEDSLDRSEVELLCQGQGLVHMTPSDDIAMDVIAVSPGEVIFLVERQNCLKG